MPWMAVLVRCTSCGCQDTLKTHEVDVQVAVGVPVIPTTAPAVPSLVAVLGRHLSF